MNKYDKIRNFVSPRRSQRLRLIGKKQLYLIAFILMIILLISSCRKCLIYSLSNRENLIYLYKNNKYYSYYKGTIEDSGTWIKKNQFLELTTCLKNKKVIIDSIIYKKGNKDTSTIVINSNNPYINGKLSMVNTNPLFVKNIKYYFSGISVYKCNKNFNRGNVSYISCNLNKYSYNSKIGTNYQDINNLECPNFNSDTFLFQLEDSVLIYYKLNFLYDNEYFINSQFTINKKKLIPR